MDTWAFRFNLYAEFIPLSDELRLLQYDFFPIRHNHAVALIPYRFQSMKHFHIFPLHLGHFFQLGKKLIFALDRFTHHITEHFIIISIIYIQNDPHTAIRHIHIIQLALLNIFAFQCKIVRRDIPDIVQTIHQLLNLRDDILLHLVVKRKHLHPFWHVEFNHGKRKLIEDILHNTIYILPFQLLTVDRHYRHLIFITDFICQLSGFFRIGLCGI